MAKIGMEAALEEAIHERKPNPHIEEVVDRIMPVLTLTQGTHEVWTRENVTRELLNLIQTIRSVKAGKHPDLKWDDDRVLVRFGPLAVRVSQRNPEENFEVFVSVAELYGMQVWAHRVREDK